MGLIRDTLKKEIETQGTQRYDGTTATIIQYYNTTNTCDIEYPNPNGDGMFRRDQVPIANTLGGLAGSGIYPGMQCSIEFRGGNVMSPLITGVLTNFYQLKTNTNQGACIVDDDILDVEIPEDDDITPMVDDWMDDTNDNTYKYANDYSIHLVGMDCDSHTYDIIRNIDHYTDNEQGMTNLDNKSTLKVKENGDIDIFVDNNVGIRISKSKQKVSLFGATIETNGQSIADQTGATIADTVNNLIDQSAIEEQQLPDTLIVSLKLSTLIAETNGKVEAFNTILEIMAKISGSMDRYSYLKMILNQYETYKKDFYENKDYMTVEELNKLYDKIYEIYRTLVQEAADISAME